MAPFFLVSILSAASLPLPPWSRAAAHACARLENARVASRPNGCRPSCRPSRKRPSPSPSRSLVQLPRPRHTGAPYPAQSCQASSQQTRRRRIAAECRWTLPPPFLLTWLPPPGLSESRSRPPRAPTPRPSLPRAHMPRPPAPASCPAAWPRDRPRFPTPPKRTRLQTSSRDGIAVAAASRKTSTPKPRPSCSFQPPQRFQRGHRQVTAIHTSSRQPRARRHSARAASTRGWIPRSFSGSTRAAPQSLRDSSPRVAWTPVSHTSAPSSGSRPTARARARLSLPPPLGKSLQMTALRCRGLS